MKKFITVLSVLALAMAMSFSADAQLIPRYHNKTKTPPPAVVQIPNGISAAEFLQSEVYQEALLDSEKGRKNFFTGVTLSLIGSAAAGVGAAMMNVGNEDIGGILIIGGGLSAIIGTVFEISGANRWAKGETTLKNLRFEYTVKANGLAISF